MKRDGFWETTLGESFSIAANMVIDSGKNLAPAPYNGLGEMASRVALTSAAGEVGSTLGTYVDNATEISNNINTFLREVNDWKSWGDVMDARSGGNLWSR
ncbi:hypothetical protein WJ41_35160 [Burkholderia ubonensis]|nr:hypothetical protein WJ41_35160 [Burkholderia ubonensis]KVT98642.1 hypothetical protein WK61_09435 [Burkholderia ubonensis]